MAKEHVFWIGDVEGKGRTATAAREDAIARAARFFNEGSLTPVFLTFGGETRIACREVGGWVVYKVEDGKLRCTATMCDRPRAEIDLSLRYELALSTWDSCSQSHPLVEGRGEIEEDFRSWARWQLAHHYYLEQLQEKGLGELDARERARDIIAGHVKAEAFGIVAWEERAA